MHLLLRAAVGAVLAVLPSALWAEELAIDGPKAPRIASLIRPAPHATTVVIVPGSLRNAGPDFAALGDALRERGFGSVRITDPAKSPGSRRTVRFAAQAAEVSAWAGAAKRATGSPCIWLLGYGDGGRTVLAAARNTPDVCGVMLVSALASPRQAKRDRAIAKLAAAMSLPAMIVVPANDPETLAAGQALNAALPDARLAIVLGMDRSLEDKSARRQDPLLAARPSAVSQRLIDALGTFMLDNGPQIQGSLYRKKPSGRGSRRA